MKKIVLFIWFAVYTVTNLYAETINPLLGEPKDHGGLIISKRGYYNTRVAEFKNDLRFHPEIFQTGKDFRQKFLDHVIFVMQDETITPQMIIDELEDGPPPAGFYKSEDATIEMCRWSSDYQTLKWGARDPKPGERFGYFRGVCVISFGCANFVRPHKTGEKVDTEDFPENEEGYVDLNEKFKAKYASYPGGNITINVNGNNGSTTTGGGTPSTRFANSSNNEGQSSEMVIRNKPNAVDWINAASNVANTVFNGINTFRGIKFANSGYQSNGWGNNNNGWNTNNSWGNNTGWGTNNQPRQYNYTDLNPQQYNTGWNTGNGGVHQGQYNNSQLSGIISGNGNRNSNNGWSTSNYENRSLNGNNNTGWSTGGGW